MVNPSAGIAEGMNKGKIFDVDSERMSKPKQKKEEALTLYLMEI